MALRRGWLCLFLGVHLVALAARAQVAVPAAVPLQAAPAAAAASGVQAALGSLFDGSKLLAPAFAPVVTPAVFSAAPAALELRKARPFDRTAPDSGGEFESIPGSIFQWKPAEESPGHGFPPIDALARRLSSRKDRRFDAGLSFGGAAAEAKVFLYGERHSDQTLILENMRRLAEHLADGRPAIVLDEGYMGRDLYGTEALRYLEGKGFDRAWLGPANQRPGIEVRGWDRAESYDRSRTATLDYSMALYDLNQHLYAQKRGVGYYRELLRKALEALRLWRRARQVAIEGRNPSLDAALAGAVASAKEPDATVHLIAGGEHLVERPLLIGLPGVRARPRGGLLEAMAGAPYWASMPAAVAPKPGAEEVAFVAKASLSLAQVAEDVGAERGLKASAMTGADFLGMIAAGQARFAEQARAKAPTPHAYLAALSVQASVLRVAKALLDPTQPLKPQVSRLLSVWQVFNQEMEAAAEKGTLEAVEAEARLFADQVEESL